MTPKDSWAEVGERRGWSQLKEPAEGLGGLEMQGAACATVCCPALAGRSTPEQLAL